MQTLKSLEKWVARKGLPKYRAKQIYQAITKNLTSSWSEAIELPKELRKILTDEFPISSLKVKNILPNSDAINRAPTDVPTIKIAFETHDKFTIESVLMRHDRERNTICVSTQIGCPMNCAFCATGKMGFKRNLAAEEIVDQVLEFAQILKNTREDLPKLNSGVITQQKVTNVVFMGMGEPFLNYENVMGAIEILNDSQGFNLGHRHMTISTSGIIPGISKFADENIQTNLAISLHAPNNEIRDSIMPVNKKYPLEKLLPAISKYMKKTKRKVFFEYILLRGINDSDKNILELITLLKKYFVDQMQLVHINLIEYNPIETQNFASLQFQSPTRQTTRHILDLLQKNKILTTIRYHFGDEIGAACGQLAGKV